MICSRCGSYNCSRSHRRKAEFVLGFIGIFPWRCLDCRNRFYARRTALRYLFNAHCPRCGNLRLLRLRRAMLHSHLGARLAALLGAQPLHCDFCRLSFASWLPLKTLDEPPAGARVGDDLAGWRE